MNNIGLFEIWQFIDVLNDLIGGPTLRCQMIEIALFCFFFTFFM